MSKKIKFLLVNIFIVSLFVSVFANDLTRVKFRKGTYGKNVVGYLNGYSAKKGYVLWAREGQTLKVGQIRNDASGKIVSLTITSPTGEDLSDYDASCNSQKEIALPETGDYQINVFECQKADAWKGNFKLNITVK